MKFLGLIKLLRPVNVLITGLSVFLGSAICGTIQNHIFPVAAAILSAGIVAGAGNVINDYFDVKIDKINKPNRPIPSGIISPKLALAFYFSLIFINLILSFFVSLTGFFIVVIVNFLMFLYSYKLKRTALWGNLTVAAVSALAFIFGGIAVKGALHAFIPAIFALLFHLGREIIKDVEDMEGDKALGASTLPIAYGAKFSINLASVIFTTLILLTLLPFLLKIYNLIYLIMVILGVDLGLIYFIFVLHQTPEKKKLHLISNILKIQMVIGIISIWVGSR